MYYMDLWNNLLFLCFVAWRMKIKMSLPFLLVAVYLLHSAKNPLIEILIYLLNSKDEFYIRWLFSFVCLPFVLFLSFLWFCNVEPIVLMKSNWPIYYLVFSRLPPTHRGS